MSLLRALLGALGLDRPRGWLLAGLLGLPTLLMQLSGPVPRLDADAVEYYSHLRSLYFDHDVDFENEFAHFGILSRWDKSQPTATGHRRTVFSVGPALLWMPFYALGDLWARSFGAVEEGYSAAHIRSVCLASLVYALLGLLLLHRVLLDLVPSVVAFWTTLLLFYGTFLVFYVVDEPVMSHACSFFMSAVVLAVWWKDRTLPLLRSALLGAAIGLAAAVRSQNGVLLLMPITSLLLQSQAWTTRFKKGAVLLLAFGVGVLPQLLVFKAIFGQYVLPYPVQGKDFLRLDHPFLLETFFSSRHGLLFWTPLLWAGFLGYVGLLRKDRGTALALLVPLAVMSYVNCCSGDWWAGGSYSNRRFDSVLPHLALGLGAFLEALRAAVVRRPGRPILAGGALLAVWNFLFMEQYRRNMIPRDDTVSFARVAENSARLVSETVGTPFAWPANWVFSHRTKLNPAQYDVSVGKYLFFRMNNLKGVIDLGDSEAEPLLGEGWSTLFRSGPSVCRRILSRARLFAPLDVPETLDVVVRAAGAGTLFVSVNKAPQASFPLRSEFQDLQTRVDAGTWHRELNEVVFLVLPGDEAFVERLVFHPVGRP